MKTNWILPLFTEIFMRVSPELKSGINEALNILQEQTKQTDNKIDDVVVSVLLAVVHIFMNDKPK